MIFGGSQRLRTDGTVLLGDVVLESAQTGTVQHRIGLVDGVRPARWGLAGNQALNDAMCEILAEAGRLES